MPYSPRLLRIVRRVLLGLAIFATLIAIAVVIENWRGDRAWEKYAAGQTARGVNLTELPSPSKLPAETNFMKTPTLDRLLWEKYDSALQKAFFADHELPMPPPSSKAFNWRNGQTLDYAPCIEKYAADRKKRSIPEIVPAATPAATLLSLQLPMEPVLDELRQAARERSESQLARPQAMNRDNPFETSFASFPFIRALTIAQASHACASLQGNQPGIALLDTLAVLKLSRGLAEAPDNFLVETMIGTVCAPFGLQPLWEGLQQHAWTSEQLMVLERELVRSDLMRSLDRALSTERVAANLMIDRWPFGKLMTGGKPSWVRAPRGWHQQNKVVLGQMSDRVHEVLTSKATPAFLTKLQHADDPPEGFGSPVSPYTTLSAAIVPAYQKITQNVVQKQSLLNLARVACALERHRIAHGGYPETLTALVPIYLDQVPLDIIDGQPLRYHRTDDGQFVLYSIGLDGKDDNRKPVDTAKVDAPGDWCWPRPAKQPDAKANQPATPSP